MNRTPYEGVIAFGSFRIKFKFKQLSLISKFRISGSNWAGRENSRPETRSTIGSTMVSTWPPQVDHSVDLGVDLPVDLPGRPGWLGLALARISVALCVTKADVSPLDWLFELCMV